MPDSRKQTRRKTLLLVYDQPHILTSFASYLAILGYDMLTAETFQEARKICLAKQPGVIVAQDVMSGETIDEFLDFVLKELPDTKVIMDQPYGMEEIRRRSEKKVFAILQKPTGFEDLTRTIERAFGIEKAQLGAEMIVHPIWRGRFSHPSHMYCFVLMPFNEPWSKRIWERHLKSIIERCGFHVRRADDFTGHDVMEDIWEGINKANVVIADITGRNPNVFYELGIAHTLGKNVILLTQEIGQTPFDVNRYRILIYEDNSDGYESLERSLTKFLTPMLKTAGGDSGAA